VSDRHAAFRVRIHQGIENAIKDITDQEPPTPGSTSHLKTVTAATSMPKYDGDDDLETFMKWLQGFTSFLDVHRLVGPENDHLRVTATRATLTGPAETWFDTSIKPGVLTSHRQYPTFLEIILRMADRFISPAVATKAQQSFDKVTYSHEKGIR